LRNPNSVETCAKIPVPATANGCIYLRSVLKACALIALALAAAPAAENLTRTVPRAHATQVAGGVRVEGTAPTLPWPTGAQAAVGASGLGVVAASPSARPLPIASVAKVMTALLTLEQRPLRAGDQGPVLTITEQEVADYHDQFAKGGSTVPVEPGEQLTEYQALEALLLPSANNIALLLARWVGGSVPAFLAEMNARAKALGMTATTYTDPSGLDPATVSVPADLVRLGEQAMNDAVFARIVAEQQANIPVAGTISNVDKLLGRDGVIGIKTGNSDQAKAVFLGAATFQPSGGQPVLVFALVQGLGSLDACFAAAQQLIDAAKGALRVVTAVARGQVLGRYAAPWGAISAVVAGADVRMLVWPGTSVTTVLRAPDIRAPARVGSVVGAIDVSANGLATAVPARLAGGLAAPNLLWLVTRDVTISTLPPMALLNWLSLSLAIAAVLLALVALLRIELQGPNVGLRLVSRPAPDAWSVSETEPAEVTGSCVALLTNMGSSSGAAWDFRVTVTSPQGTFPVAASVVPPSDHAGATPDVVQVDPRSSVGLLVTIWLPLDIARAPGGDLRVAIDCGATRWPWGRATRLQSALAIPQGEVGGAVERWSYARNQGAGR
jgi:serine-type D-Ala-D-Ala carboxypeptidase (penicillin-binding protein 5/6)